MVKQYKLISFCSHKDGLTNSRRDEDMFTVNIIIKNRLTV